MTRPQAMPLAVVLLAYCIYAFTSSARTAPTSDEIPHLAAGYVALQTGDRTLNAEHPPLVKMLAAAALREHPHVAGLSQTRWSEIDEWEFGRQFLYHSGADAQALVEQGRIAPIVIGGMLCLICFCWSRSLFGFAGGVTSLCLCAFCPTILAHARLITTDVPLGAAGVAAAFAAWRLLMRPSRQRAVVLGLCAGLMLSAKYSGVILLAALAIAIAAGIVVLPKWKRPRLSSMATMLLWSAAAAWFVLSLVYGTAWFPPMYFEGVKTVGFNHNPAYRFYLLGEFRAGGFPSYFPTAFLLKASPALLLAMFAGSVAALRALARGCSRETILPWIFILIPAVSYGGFIMLKAPDIGVRYLLPVFPFIFVGCGALGATLSQSRPGKFALAGLLALHVHAAVDAWPDPISYFNGLGGCSGPQAIACLDDSNLDWGQDLLALSESLKGEGEVALLYFGSTDPGAYFSAWRPVTKSDVTAPRPALYAMSIHGLNRLNRMYARPAGLDWFARFRPARVIGNTYYLYDFRRGVP